MGVVQESHVFYYLFRKDDVSDQMDGIDYITSHLVGDERRAVWDISHQGAYRQLSLFDDMKLNLSPAPDRYSVVTGSM